MTIISFSSRLFNFPTNKKKPTERLKWKSLVNSRKDKSGKLWSPKKCSKVCSLRFIDGEPTEQNPYPTENLGYDSSSKIKHVAGKKRRSLEYRHGNSNGRKKKSRLPLSSQVENTTEKEQNIKNEQLYLYIYFSLFANIMLF